MSEMEYEQHDDDVEVDDTEDFYGSFVDDVAPRRDAQTGPGAEQQTSNDVTMANTTFATRVKPAMPQLPTLTPTPNKEPREENILKAALLRAKLLAQRQNTDTPIKKSQSPANTPGRVMPVRTAGPMVDARQPADAKAAKTMDHPSIDVLGLDSLLAEGKAAAAEASMKAEHAKVNGTTPFSANEIKPPQNQTPSRSNTTAHPPNTLSDAYYADLPAWLELTGYHNEAFRSSKLRTHKERRQLEEEAARIQARLDNLRAAEQESAQSFRSSIGPQATTSESAPPLPPAIPSGDAAFVADVARGIMTTPSATNGVKRSRSPEPAQGITNTRRRPNDPPGYRIRGAIDSPPGPRRTSPRPLERRISYPDARRASYDQARSRDPSLERRQAYYRRDSELGAPVAPPQYEQYAPRPPLRASDYRGGAGPREYQNSYKGSMSLDLRKGGVRYFIIKSWNLENVLTCQRDGLWATQEKNEQLLRDAFDSSRHVILLFSVNKSMAFQGFAVMTSPPDLHLPKPPFCAKLNWGTSPAFTLQWLAKTPVHFRMVGHLKNSLNLDERGEPRAVLVGKDGQEVSEQAGRGVVGVLEEAEAVEWPM